MAGNVKTSILGELAVRSRNLQIWGSRRAPGGVQEGSRRGPGGGSRRPSKTRNFTKFRLPEPKIWKISKIRGFQNTSPKTPMKKHDFGEIRGFLPILAVFAPGLTLPENEKD